MVTMNSLEKAAQKACQQGTSRDSSKCTKEEKKKEENAIANLPPSVQALMSTIPSPEESPNYLIYKKMEAIIEKMQDEHTGVPVRTVKSFMSKIPSVFTGSDLVAWLMRHLSIEETWEALHLAHLLAAHGYLFPIDDHCLTVKNDNTYYRFQTPYFWPSNQWEPENTDYVGVVYLPTAVYLCKRTMQNKARLELADYEAESLARLQKMFSRKWEFIFMQAEAQSKVDKKRDKLERKVLDSQERAFWDVHRPMPGCVNTTELDPRKMSRISALKAKRMRQCQELIQQHNLKNNPIVTITNPQESEEEIQRQSSDSSTKQNGECSQPQVTVSCTAEATTKENEKPKPTVEQEIEAARRQVCMLKQRMERRNIRVSKVAEIHPIATQEAGNVLMTPLDLRLSMGDSDHLLSVGLHSRELCASYGDRPTNTLPQNREIRCRCITYYEQYAEYDAFLTPPEWPNPWISDTTELWEQEKHCKDPLPLRRVRRWSFGLRELLQDPAGRDHFSKFLHKEFSGENLKFWLAVQELKTLPVRRVAARARDIWKEFLASDAPSPINVDAASRELTRVKVESGTADRYCFDQAQAHVYHLMKSDSYSRYLRSEMYKDYLNGSKKKAFGRLFLSPAARRRPPTERRVSTRRARIPIGRRRRGVGSGGGFSNVAPPRTDTVLSVFVRYKSLKRKCGVCLTEQKTRKFQQNTESAFPGDPEARRHKERVPYNPNKWLARLQTQARIVAARHDATECKFTTDRSCAKLITGRLSVVLRHGTSASAVLRLSEKSERNSSFCVIALGGYRDLRTVRKTVHAARHQPVRNVGVSRVRIAGCSASAHSIDGGCAPGGLLGWAVFVMYDEVVSRFNGALCGSSLRELFPPVKWTFTVPPQRAASPTATPHTIADSAIFL
ncbi:Regulator of G-protein signaling 7 [Eumeta japonica]|uniref:Regulator of G-protein signaling 7 n=1 Tax=Eumeta variegata TaxID=151549 RepID=A0A4C1VVH7_EUMVA|nr:Regulator of G-protein signaling 7 [Eumeta japonica]